MTHATKAIYRWLLSDYVKVRYVSNVCFQLLLYNILHESERASKVTLYLFLLFSYSKATSQQMICFIQRQI